MLASFPLPGLTPAILSTTLLPLMIPVVAMRNLRPVDPKNDQHSKYKCRIRHAPLFCLATHRMAAISVYVQPPRKKTTVVLVCSLEEAKMPQWGSWKSELPDTYFEQSNQGLPRPPEPTPSVRNPPSLQEYSPTRLQILSTPR